MKINIALLEEFRPRKHNYSVYVKKPKNPACWKRCQWHQKKGLEYQGFLIPFVVWAWSLQLGLEKPELSICAAACSA